MTEKSDKLMEKLVQIADWVIDDRFPTSEKLKLIPKIHEISSSIKSELPNMSNAEKVNLSSQLILLKSIVRSSAKLENG